MYSSTQLFCIFIEVLISTTVMVSPRCMFASKVFHMLSTKQSKSSTFSTKSENNENHQLDLKLASSGHNRSNSLIQQRKQY
jgi:hypothetical protein